MIVARFIGLLMDIVGRAKVEVEAEGAMTLHELIRIISESYNRDFERAVLAEEGISTNVVILLNGKSAGLFGGLKAVVDAGDEVVFMPFIGGG
ncbi:MAG: MoaD/ThiS family protein [Candidatus Geothermarchaeales archaeon]